MGSPAVVRGSGGARNLSKILRGCCLYGIGPTCTPFYRGNPVIARRRRGLQQWS